MGEELRKDLHAEIAERREGDAMFSAQLKAICKKMEDMHADVVSIKKSVSSQKDFCYGVAENWHSKMEVLGKEKIGFPMFKWIVGTVVLVVLALSGMGFRNAMNISAVGHHVATQERIVKLYHPFPDKLPRSILGLD